MKINEIRLAGVLALALSCAPALAVDPDDRWDTSMGGCNGIIYELHEGPEGLIYVGGSFTECGSVVTPGVAVFDPAEDQWSSLGGDETEGVSGTVYALFHHDDGLYVGGQFVETWGNDAIEVNRVARWDLENQTWSELDGGVSHPVHAFEVHGGALYVGGEFWYAGSDNALEVQHVARWDGLQWSALESPDGGYGVMGKVEAMVSAWDALYVGGEFPSVNWGGDSTHFFVGFLARWEGNQWSALGTSGGTGVSNAVRDLAYINDSIIVSGDFTAANHDIEDPGPENDILARRVAIWDGSEWMPMDTPTGNGANQSVLSVSEGGDRIYLGGQFVEVNVDDPIPAARVAWWDGQAFGSLGSGANNLIRVVLMTASGDLYVGGHFSEAGGQSAERFARYTTRGGLDIELAGSGSGSVSVDPVSLVCSEDCSADLSWDQALEINASAGAFSTFAGFSGDVCSGVGACSFDFEEPATIIAQFDLVTHAVDVTSVIGDGSISLMNQEIEHGASVTWTVSPDSGWAVHEFAGDTCQPEDNGDGTWSAQNITSPCAIEVEFRHDVGMEVQLSMNPAIIGLPVTYEIALTGYVSTPADGQVTVTATTGENCIDSTTPPASDGMTAFYSCEILYSGTGARPLQVNYSGSSTHVSAQDASVIQNVVGNEFIFHDRFEDEG